MMTDPHSYLRHPDSERLGIIAGGGEAPRRLIAMCQSIGREVFVVCLKGQTDPDLCDDSVPHVWLPLGAAGQLKDIGDRVAVRDVVLIGKVRRPSLSEIKPDWLALRVLTKAGFNMLGDDGLLRAIARAIEEEGGVRIVGIHQVFADLLMPAGVLGRHQPDETALADIERGKVIAATLGRLDIGQAVIVQEGIVLGVEASEGTDFLMKRTATLKREGPGGVLVKMCKPTQDKRFDLPTIGPETVRQAAAAGLRGIAMEAKGSLLIARDEVVAEANAAGLFVVGYEVKSNT
jgi:UDP-2,3-diacylglucosamine hydrolase